MTAEIAVLALLVFALIATRPLEEGRWRAGRLSDRASARLLVARLPLFALAWALVVGLPPLACAGMGLIALGLAMALAGPVERRLARARGN